MRKSFWCTFESFNEPDSNADGVLKLEELPGWVIPWGEKAEIGDKLTWDNPEGLSRSTWECAHIHDEEADEQRTAEEEQMLKDAHDTSATEGAQHNP